MRLSFGVFVALLAGCSVYDVSSRGTGDNSDAGWSSAGGQAGVGTGSPGGTSGTDGGSAGAGGAGNSGAGGGGGAGGIGTADGGGGRGGASGTGSAGGSGGGTGSGGTGSGGTGSGGTGGGAGTGAGGSATGGGGATSGSGGAGGGTGGAGGSGGSGISTHAFLESGGAFSIEAEHFAASFPGTGAAQGVTWQNSTAQPNTSGSCEQALPNVGVSVGDSTEGAQLAFDLKFSGTGTYFVWVRILGPNNQSNSVHVAMDSAPPVTYGGHGMRSASTTWVWVDTVSLALAPDGGPVTAQINVTAPGYHTLRVYMRESGVAVDKIVLNQGGPAPSGMGPSESARE
jgi:Gylcosyl hydrolase family 115 C-terminal domain